MTLRQERIEYFIIIILGPPTHSYMYETTTTTVLWISGFCLGLPE